MLIIVLSGLDLATHDRAAWNGSILLLGFRSGQQNDSSLLHDLMCLTTDFDVGRVKIEALGDMPCSVVAQIQLVG